MPSLNLREAQVMELASLGLTTKEIAAALGIKVHTVNWHRRQALARQSAARPQRVVSTRRRIRSATGPATSSSLASTTTV
jgi:DNA-binding NarL/FixJ family response regulator